MLPSSSGCEVAATCSDVDILFRDDALAGEAVVIDAQKPDNGIRDAELKPVGGSTATL
jgi:hypothetical protein